MKQLLLTGFGPFRNYSSNPSEVICRGLNNSIINNFHIHSQILDVNFKNSYEKLLQRSKSIEPDIIISLGLSYDSNLIKLEKIAKNLMKNHNQDSVNKIDEHAPDAYFSKLPLKNIHQFLNLRGINSEISNSAGDYVCNYIMFKMLNYLQKSKIHTPYGFIHIPADKILKDDSNWDIYKLSSGIKATIESF